MVAKFSKSRKLVFCEGKSNKFWNIALKGKSFKIIFGRIGTTGQTQEKSFDSAEEAKARFDKLVVEKLKKGYVDATTVKGKANKNQAAAKFSGPKGAAKSKKENPEPPRTITNGIGMNLVLIPAGTFLMGSTKKEQVREDEQVQHQVTLTRDFYLGMTQVTQAQYKKVMGMNPSYFRGKEVKGRDSSEFPVDSVSWEDGLEFCKKLSALPEEKKAGRVYRLPTEAEWEYACRAGTTTDYSFGDDETKLKEYAWFSKNSARKTHAVGQKKPNPWGLYDMHGNVWEWCRDRIEKISDFRVSRGGSWLNAAALCRSARRGGIFSSYRSSTIGFRVALSSRGIPK